MVSHLLTGSRILIFCLLVFIVTSGDPLASFTRFAPVPQTIFLFSILLFMLARKQITKLLDYSNRIPDKVFLPVMVSIAFAIIATAAITVLDKIPHVTDSVAYLFQAKALAKGMFAIPAGNMPEFYMPHFYYQSDGRMISLFQPGWPLILSLGVLLKAEFLVNPMLGAITLWPAYKIFKRCFGQGLARLAIIIIMCSPFYLFMSASFMAHTISGLLGLIAINHALIYKDHKKTLSLVIIGVCVGFLFCIRAFNSVILLAPLTVVFLPLILKKQLPVKAIVIGIIAGLPFFIAQLSINHHITGNALSFPQDKYFEATEVVASCHRLGFGPDVGCSSEHGRYSFPDGYYLPEAISVTKHRLVSLSLNLFGTPMALIILLFPILMGRFKHQTWIIYSIPASLIICYMLFYYHGNCYGPRFYYEAVAPIGMLIALGIYRLDTAMEYLSKVAPTIKAFLRATSPALLLTLLLFSIGWMHPRLWETYSHFRNVDDHIKQLTVEAGLSNAVVILPGTRSSLAAGFNYNSPTLDNDVIFARHIYAHSVQLMYQYPDRDFYRFDVHRDKIVKIKKHPFEGVIFTEMDSKVPALKVEGGIAFENDVTLYRPGAIEASQLYFKGEIKNSSFTIGQFIFEEGKYLIEMDAIQGSHISNWHLEINGKKIGNTFQGYANKYKFERWNSGQAIHLKKGMAEFRFVAGEKDLKAVRYGIGIDWMILRQVPDGIDKEIPQIIDVGYYKNDKYIDSTDIPWDWRGRND